VPTIKGVGDSIHMRLEALCASMQRHGVTLADLDRLRTFTNTLLDETERRLAARALRPSEASPTQPEAPRSITQRLRRLADDEPDDG
jgi:hypothetical protein